MALPGFFFGLAVGVVLSFTSFPAHPVLAIWVVAGGAFVMAVIDASLAPERRKDLK